jgi:hypothetical protein
MRNLAWLGVITALEGKKKKKKKKKIMLNDSNNLILQDSNFI